MLDRLYKKLLDFLIEQDVETYYVCAFSEAFSNSANITIDELAKKLNTPTEQLRACIRYLYHNGYLEYQKTTNGQSVGFYLSHVGYNYRQFRLLKFEDFLLRSVFTPIAISVITTVVTIFISSHT